jgi:hypothetical protein
MMLKSKDNEASPAQSQCDYNLRQEWTLAGWNSVLTWKEQCFAAEMRLNVTQSLWKLWVIVLYHTELLVLIYYCCRLHNSWHKYTTRFPSLHVSAWWGHLQVHCGFTIACFSCCYSPHTGQCLHMGSAWYIWSLYALPLYCLWDI